jgi:hypothetical protein
MMSFIAAKAGPESQGLTLVHFSAQPEPFFGYEYFTDRLKCSVKYEY